MSSGYITSESYADCYCKSRSDNDGQAAAILELISNHIGSIDNISVLDIGSGPGRLAVPIGRLVHRIVCVEPDLLAASYLKSRAKKSKVHIELHTAKIQELSNKNLGCFDLVILSHIIHWFDASPSFGFSTNFVIDGGYILLSYFDLDRLKNMLFYKISGTEILEIQEEDTPSMPDIEFKLSQVGFEVIERIDFPLNVSYGNGRLERIIKSSGTLAWQKLRKNFHEDKYRQIKLRALTRLENESCLTDTEYRTMILAKKVAS